MENRKYYKVFYHTEDLVDYYENYDDLDLFYDDDDLHDGASFLEFLEGKNPAIIESTISVENFKKYQEYRNKHKKHYSKEFISIGTYAIEEDGKYYEPMTGKLLTDCHGDGPLYYERIEEIKEAPDFVKMSDDISFINSFNEALDQYIEELEKYSEITYKVNSRIFEEETMKQNEIESSLQYLKAYKIPKQENHEFK